MVHWPACGGRPRRVHSQKQRQTGHNSALLRQSIVRLSLIVCSPVRRLRSACASPSLSQQRYRRHAVIGCVTRRLSMINTSKLALIAVLAAMSVASPAFAQSFNKGDGTGNELTFAYGPNGAKPAWTVAPQNEQIAVRQSNTGKVAIRQTGHARFAVTGTTG